MYSVKRFVTQASCGFVALCLLLLVGGCSKPLDEAIVGKWDDGEDSVTELFPDHTMVVNHGNQQMSGQWAVVGKDRIKLEMKYAGIPIIMTWDNLKIDGDMLTCTYENKGKEVTLQAKRKK